MKRILEFECPEDDDEYKLVSQAHRMALVILRMQDELRKVVKYGKPNKTDRKWQQKLWDIIKEYELDI
jgi:hypothetical protein